MALGRPFGRKKSVFILTARDSDTPRATKVQTYYKGVSVKSLYYETLYTDASAVNCVTVYESFLIKRDVLRIKSKFWHWHELIASGL